MKQIILIAGIALILSGCTTERKCSRKFPPETMVIRKDSIIRTTNTVYKDTLVYVYLKGETRYSTDTVWLENGILKSNTNHLFTSFADSWAWVENGKLYHKLIQKDTLIGQEVSNAIRLTLERAEKYYSQSEVQVKTERYIPKWVWWCLGISVLAIGHQVFKILRAFKIL